MKVEEHDKLHEIKQQFSGIGQHPKSTSQTRNHNGVMLKVSSNDLSDFDRQHTQNNNYEEMRRKNKQDMQQLDRTTDLIYK